MADLKHLCHSLLHAMDAGNRDLEDHIVCQIRTELAKPEPEGPTPQPISVSERLPGPEDSDEQGRCWWFNDEDGALCSHWLPAHALPLPE